MMASKIFQPAGRRRQALEVLFWDMTKFPGWGMRSNNIKPIQC